MSYPAELIDAVAIALREHCINRSGRAKLWEKTKEENREFWRKEACVALGAIWQFAEALGESTLEDEQRLKELLND